MMQAEMKAASEYRNNKKTAMSDRMNFKKMFNGAA